ncbi:DUF6382 domain-containing protein [Paenibacillus senegalimassiliensis]|uniref:DUF6382 domain-containing protein n=1 Tax=Paenibacillus senegalimassiliensis TaxID=1737426 RepID=UPI00073F87E8|nr:DUF6382 domain-containing protein [Paenibacillus senegalimassiliensis]
MPQLHADFIRDGGTYMILQAQDESFHPDLLNRVERSMLAAVSVPRLLKLDVREIDFEISLHFDITGKRMLSHCLRTDQMGLMEFYGLLLQVVAVLEEGRKYMLNPGNFILDEQHIFVENPLSWGTLHFTYIPWKHRTDGAPLSQALLGLITRLLTCVAQVEGQGIPQLVKLCGDESFSLGGLKKLLLELLAGDQFDQPRLGEAGAPHRLGGLTGEGGISFDSEEGGQLPGKRERASIFSSPNQASAAVGSTLIKEYVTPEEAGIGEHLRPYDGDEAVAPRLDWPGVSEDEQPKLRLKPTYLLLGAILAAALCWKLLYIDQPGQIGLYTCVLITVLLIAMVYWIWRKGITFDVPEAEEEHRDSQIPPSVNSDYSVLSSNYAASEEASEGVVNQRGGLRGSALQINLPSVPSVPSVSRLSASSTSQSSVWNNSESNAIDAPLSPPTMLLSRSMLSEHNGEALPSTPRFYLERSDGQGMGTTPEQISLSPGSLVIGRSEELVQFVEDSTGVSRAHVEVMVSSQGCTLKDLGSTNGTRLKGELIAPYKAYPLAEGDVFSLAEVNFKLVMNSVQ